MIGFVQKVKSIVILAFLVLLLSCSMAVHPGKVNPAENRFFVLDFANDKLSMEDVKEHFFTTYPHDEPTGGPVVYDRVKWTNQEMFRLQPGDGFYLYIKSRGDSLGYDSFRLTSKAYYNLTNSIQRILFVFKGQLPSGKGIWPAWWLNGSREKAWTYERMETIPGDNDLDRYSGKGHFYDTSSPVNGTDWPAGGEIDIIETINGDNLIHNTLHTCPRACNAIWNSGNEMVNCANATAVDPNAGCSGVPYSVEVPEGTFACILEKNRLRFYYWSPEEDVRSPGGPLSQTPDPSLWDVNHLKNVALLLDSDIPCNPHEHQSWQCKNCAESNHCTFYNLKMIFNTTLCGKWAGRLFDDSDQPAENCENYVFGKGQNKIHNQYLKIEYVAVRKL